MAFVGTKRGEHAPMSDMRRRAFITLLGGAAAWPLAARAQQSSRLRRVGVLMTFAADDPDGQANFAALAQGLQEFGWTVGRNLRLDYRWGANDLDRFRTYATVGRSEATEPNLAFHRDIDPVRMMRTRFADPIRASSPPGLHQQAGHMTASDLCAARQMISCQAGAIHT